MFSAAWNRKNLYALHKAWFVNLSARLVSVDLSENNLEELPDELFNILPALEVLDVSKNKLEYLPEVISSYTRYYNHIQVLYVGGYIIIPITEYSCFNKGCPTKVQKHNIMRQCRLALWVVRVWFCLIEVQGDSATREEKLKKAYTCLCCFLEPHWNMYTLRFKQTTVKATITHNNLISRLFGKLFPICKAAFLVMLSRLKFELNLNVAWTFWLLTDTTLKRECNSERCLDD